MPKELWKLLFRGRLYRRVYEELDTLVDPYAPLPFSDGLRQHELKVDPIGIDTPVNLRIRFDPVAVDVARIWLLRARTPVDVDLLKARRPKSFYSGAEPLQESAAARRETEALGDLLQSCLTVTRWQGASLRVERRNQAASIISNTTQLVNGGAD